MWRGAFLAAMVAACASTPSPPPDAAPIIDAEHAFMAVAAERGCVAAYHEFFAPDGVLLRPEITTHEQLGMMTDRGDTSLSWRPAFAGGSRAGDFGFTAGPVFWHGREGASGLYFTLWRREGDGAWRWIFNSNVAAPDANLSAGEGPSPAETAAPARAVGSAARAIDEVRAIEAAADGEALTRLLAPDARVLRSRAALTAGADAAALMQREGAVQWTSIRADASTAGDMVFTLSQARWQGAEGERWGYTGRVWRRDVEGWRIVFDQLVPLRGPPSAN